jgi:hypothetical protein
MKARFHLIAAALLATGGGLATFALQAPTVHAEVKPAAPAPAKQIVAMRRMTESQYRNSIADIFGPDVVPTGRFEPIVRTSHQLIASDATSAAISPTGLEQFDTMARGVAAQVFDEAHRASFMTCRPKDEAKPDARCATQVLGQLGRYVLRRPLTADETAAYAAMAGAASDKSGSFYEGMELALAAMLVSPEFLYVVETAEPDPDQPGDLRLDNYSRAARLSYFLWNTTPDKALLDAAAAGKLTDPDQLRLIAERMVHSPRLQQGVRAFFADMLKFEKFEELAKDPVVYPRFNPDVAKAMPEQIERTIVDHLVTRQGDYRALFTTPHTFMTRALGPLYYVPVHQRDGWEPYTFTPGDDRAGLLGQAGFLALYSHSGRSSPTLRGRAVRELLLCEPVPNPPGNVNFTVVQDTTNPVLRTARQRLTAHATDPSCTGCHKITDPLGLSLEGFDGIGATRLEENGQPLDLTGQMDSATFKGATGLGKTLAADPALTECVASRTLEYALGHSTDEMGETVSALDQAFAAQGYRYPELMLAIATLPEAYRVKANPLAPATPVALNAPFTKIGARR